MFLFLSAWLESQISLRKSESIQEEDEEAEGIHSKEEDLVLRDNKDTEGESLNTQTNQRERYVKVFKKQTTEEHAENSA